MSRYHLVDTMSGEVLRETSTNPLLHPLRHKPRGRVRRLGGHRPSRYKTARLDADMKLVLITMVAGLLLASTLIR